MIGVDEKLPSFIAKSPTEAIQSLPKLEQPSKPIFWLQNHPTSVPSLFSYCAMKLVKSTSVYCNREIKQKKQGKLNPDYLARDYSFTEQIGNEVAESLPFSFDQIIQLIKSSIDICSNLGCRKVFPRGCGVEVLSHPGCPSQCTLSHVCPSKQFTSICSVQCAEFIYKRVIGTTFYRPLKIYCWQYMSFKEFSLPPNEILILVGNLHELDYRHGPNNTHKWTMYVKGNNLEPIFRVEFGLHPTFVPPVIGMSTPPYQITRYGWGIFSINIEIHFKPEYKTSPKKISHMLSFNEDNLYAEYILKLNEIPRK